MGTNKSLSCIPSMFPRNGKVFDAVRYVWSTFSKPRCIKLCCQQKHRGTPAILAGLGVSQGCIAEQ